MCDPEFQIVPGLMFLIFTEMHPSDSESRRASSCPYLLKRTISKYIVITRIDDYKEQTIQ